MGKRSLAVALCAHADTDGHIPRQPLAGGTRFQWKSPHSRSRQIGLHGWLDGARPLAGWTVVKRGVVGALRAAPRGFFFMNPHFHTALDQPGDSPPSWVGPDPRGKAMPMRIIAKYWELGNQELSTREPSRQSVEKYIEWMRREIALCEAYLKHLPPEHTPAVEQ